MADECGEGLEREREREKQQSEREREILLCSPHGAFGKILAS